MKFLVWVAAVAVGLFVAATVPALAHSHLRSSAPAADEVLDVSPRQLDLRFSQSLVAVLSAVVLHDATGAVVATAPIMLDPGDDARLIVPLATSLSPGVYSVDWQSANADGHMTWGSYRFTVVH